MKKKFVTLYMHVHLVVIWKLVLFIGQTTTAHKLLFKLQKLGVQVRFPCTKLEIMLSKLRAFKFG